MKFGISSSILKVVGFISFCSYWAMETITLHEGQI